VDWIVWLGAELPGPPGTQTFTGVFTPESDDGTTNPPAVYSYIDLTLDWIVVPSGATIYFGYENPGIGGQISANGVETWGWYEGEWDPDSGWGRTAVLQVKANCLPVAAEHLTFSRIKALFD
jgi:hypothetical protein